MNGENDVDAARDGHEWGKCIVGQTADCVMNQPGFYTYRTMDIYWTVGSNDNEDFTVLNIPLTQKTLAPVMHCPDGEWCRGTIDCSMIGSQPCSRTLTTCDGTAPPTASPIEPPTLDPTLDPTQSPTGPTDPPTSSPTKVPSRGPTNSPTRDPLTPTNSPTRNPTANPTLEPTAASHGDPIIWTFFGECYDLNKDGIYLATSHPQINHDVYIAVYNDYMREIQIQDKNGDILLSVSNLGEVVNNWPYRFSEEIKKCPDGEEGCNLFFTEHSFDA